MSDSFRLPLDIEAFIRDFRALETSDPIVISWRSFADADATPDVSSGSYWKTANTGATTITNFDSPLPDGQKIHVLFTDTNTTIQNNANIVLQSGRDFTGAVDDVKIFLYDETNWVEQAPDVDIAKYILVKLNNPKNLQGVDNEQGVWDVTPAAMTISKITVSLDAAGNQVAGDLKYADAFIGLANPVVINAFDTASGVLSDDSITNGQVPAGKCIYLSFDSAPSVDITQKLMTIYFTWD